MKQFLTVDGRWIEIKNPSKRGKLFWQCQIIAEKCGVEVKIPLQLRDVPDNREDYGQISFDFD